MAGRGFAAEGKGGNGRQARLAIERGGSSKGPESGNGRQTRLAIESGGVKRIGKADDRGFYKWLQKLNAALVSPARSGITPSIASKWACLATCREIIGQTPNLLIGSHRSSLGRGRGGRGGGQKQILPPCTCARLRESLAASSLNTSSSPPAVPLGLLLSIRFCSSFVGDRFHSTFCIAFPSLFGRPPASASDQPACLMTDHPLVKELQHTRHAEMGAFERRKALLRSISLLSPSARGRELNWGLLNESQ
ncbi:unnamed protein product [Calypogeia fissa]